MPGKIRILVVLVVMAAGCSLVGRQEQPSLLDAGGDGDSDGDTDSDVEVDGDGDGDGDSDEDTDSELDSDTDGDVDADGDSDAEVECTEDEGCDDEDACTEDSCDDDGVCHHDLVDADNDGHEDEACGGDDCDDANPTVYPDAPELCDEADNDCDEEIDEGVNACGGACPIIVNAPGTACDGMDTDLCSDDEYECDGRNATACPTGDNNPESCNDEDDNCDGTTDEGCPCSDGEIRDCGSDVGECAIGVQTCDETGSWGFCEGGVGPVDEECNALDDNCDGATDEGDNACGGVCELADRPGSPCDGDDADLCSDDSYECNGLNDAVCSTGDDNAELCNEEDDDCDGTVDEGDNACGGVCSLANAPGTACDGSDSDLCPDDEYECTGPNATVCSAGTDTIEVCDGRVDEDCDGRTDEECICIDDRTLPCGSDVGECATGTQTCRGGEWLECEDDVRPVDELCDTLDNDCDEAVDEGANACGGVCELDHAPRTACDGIDADLCEDDSYECSGLNTTSCSAGADNVETCNGVDDDCDGTTDEGSNACGGVCFLVNVPGTACDGADTDLCSDDEYECSGLNATACSTGEDTVEVCDGETDEDCDGLVDEGVLPPIGCRPDGVSLPPESGAWILFCFPDSRRRDLWMGGQEDGGGVTSGWSITCTTTSSIMWCNIPPALTTYDTVFFDVSTDGTWTCPTSTPIAFSRGRQLCAAEIRTDRSPIGVSWTHGSCYFSVRP